MLRGQASARIAHWLLAQRILPSGCATIGIGVVAVEASTTEATERSFATLRRERSGGVIVATDALFTGQTKLIGVTGTRERIPSMFSHSDFVKAGGLRSYGLDNSEDDRRAAVCVDTIFNLETAVDRFLPLGTRYELQLFCAPARSPQW